MVSLSQVRASNSLISSTFPEKLVAVFVGGTSGIGEETAKYLAKYAKSPRIYIAGRSRDAGDRVLAECKRINPSGQYIFCKSDVSLIRGADELCNEIKKEESFINLLVMSQGVYDFSRSGENKSMLHICPIELMGENKLPPRACIFSPR
jgi:NADP-dependent 3-hydroxy acid dehydrogenase YdfG